MKMQHKQNDLIRRRNEDFCHTVSTCASKHGFTPMTSYIENCFIESLAMSTYFLDTYETVHVPEPQQPIMTCRIMTRETHYNSS